jgi:hypothetical protein
MIVCWPLAVPTVRLTPVVELTTIHIPFLCLAPDFQILHAMYSIERILNQFLTRSAVFEVIFWDGKIETHLHLYHRSNQSFFRGRASDYSDWRFTCCRHSSIACEEDPFQPSADLERHLGPYLCRNRRPCMETASRDFKGELQFSQLSVQITNGNDSLSSSCSMMVALRPKPPWLQNVFSSSVFSCSRCYQAVSRSLY